MVDTQVTDVSATIMRRVESALKLAEQAGKWLPSRGRDGTKFYAIRSESQPKRLPYAVYHLVNCRWCDCPDFKRRASYHRAPLACKHILAVRLYVRALRGETPDPVLLALTEVEPRAIQMQPAMAEPIPF